MARIYAGLLGPLAMLTALLRGVIHGGSTQSILFSAWCSLLLFATIGYVVGWIAGQIVDQSVNATISAELAAREAAQAPAEQSGD